MSAAPLVVLAAGGTGGHVFPAEALAEVLLARGCRLALVTDRRGGSHGGTLGRVETHRIRAGGLAGKSWLARLKAVPELLVGLFQARGLLGTLLPDVVVGFGGYASVPTMMAASLSGVATLLHEQNAVLGRANRLLAPRVKRIATSFEQVEAVPPEARDRLVHTGMPVRPAVAAMRDRPYDQPGAEGPVKLLVLGGSQGARVLSDVLPAAVALLPETLRRRLDIVQQCRPEDLERVKAAYAVLGMAPTLASFFDDIPERLAACHLLIGRAGASTVAEVLAVGRPSILVPYPHAIDDHQAANGHALDEVGAGWLMMQDSFTPEALAARLESLLAHPDTLGKAAACARAAGRPDAADRLADMVLGLLPEIRRSAA